MSDAWTALTTRIRELDAIGSASALLEWDQQTYLPVGGSAGRGAQSAVLGRIAHERWTDPDVGRWIAAVAEAPEDDVQRAAARAARRRYDRSTRLPARLVEELAVARNEGFGAWMKAREENDPTPFLKPLQRLIDLSREQAERLGDAVHPYDALLEEYDPGATVADLAPMFRRLSEGLGELLAAIEGRPHPDTFSTRLDADGQRRLSTRLLRDLGFDLGRGRLDLSEHPFTCGITSDDVRLTTHIHEDQFLDTLGSTVHECGHGLYEQGVPASLAGTGLNRAAGCGIHESQSRFWENFIGRSLPFFRFLVPRMGGIWPDLAVTPEQLYGAANRVERSLIRVAADEATYNLHIIARFELEVALFEGRLQAADLPGAWDEAYRKHVGVVATEPRQGVLQDVHWSSGYFGYFPSYTVGNLYAASFGAVIQQDLPDLWTDVEGGRFADVLGWLREKVHRRGHMQDAPDIFRAIVGDRDPVADLLGHLWSRHGRLYGVTAPAAK